MISSNVMLLLLQFFSLLSVHLTSGALSIEFELLRYKNSGGKLLNGDCCNGLKVPANSTCNSNGISCNPFWKICVTHQPHVGESQVVIIPTQMRSRTHSTTARVKHRPSNKPVRASSKNRNEQVSVTIATVNTSTTTERPSFLKSIYNRVLGGIKSVQSVTEYVSFSGAKSTHAVTPSCSLAFWTTNVTHVIDDKNKVVLKADVPLGILSNMKNETTKKVANHDLENILVFVEVWNKKIGEEAGEKLIARHVQQTNVTIQVRRNRTLAGDDDEYEWTQGGIPSSHSSVPAASGNKSLSSIHSYEGTQFKYRWRILGNEDGELETNSTTACPEGFKGLNCRDPLCSPGCNISHGYCEKPAECKCKFGWTGETCDQCLSMPGCVHGSCVKPFECRCQDGWSGMFCDKPTCKLGCHPQNGYCEHPGECRCRFGFKGENCSDCATMPGCQRGSCDQPLDCNCHQGWRGLFCSIPSCSEGCDLDHGWCRRPNECRCKVGWTGANCTECVPYPGCAHGSCSEPWTCNCDPGYGGMTCEEKLDVCEKMETNPCQNGGTCLSVEKAEGGFICQCSDGHEGHYCEKIKN